MNRTGKRLRVKLLGLTALLFAPVGCGRFAVPSNSEGVALYQQGNYLGAVSSFQRALAEQPGNPDCFYNLGATYHQQAKLFGRPADRETAAQYYHLCLSRNPNHSACQRAMAVWLVEDGREQEALQQLADWAAREPASPEPKIELARMAQERGDPAAAQQYLTEALAVAPGNSRALVALGRLRETQGDYARALASYQQALESDKNQPTVVAKVETLARQVSAPPGSWTPAATTAALPVPTGAPAQPR